MATKKTGTPLNKLQQMRQDYAKALEEAFKFRMSEHNVQQTAKQYADEAIAFAIGSKIGLKRNTWGDWEVDVKANSSFMDMLRVAVNEVVTTSFAPLVAQAFAGLTEADKKSVMKQYREKLKEELEDRLDTLAQEQADKVVRAFTLLAEED